MKIGNPDMLSAYLTALKNVTAGLAIVALILGAAHFPRDTDAPLSAQEIEAAQKYYEQSYERPARHAQQTTFETKYLEVAHVEAQTSDIEGKVRAFAHDYGLTDKAVLEIGSGRGHLQDIVDNYTGLDISTSAARFYHKRFVVGSATAMPFPDNSFDGVWSIWVFEHVPNPEQAFQEARRVTRDGGYLYLFPGFMSAPWGAEGYDVRPYSDFDLTGKLIKASIPVRNSGPFRALSMLPIRAVRSVAAMLGPTTLRYNRLTPNYKVYWQPDSDAVNSIDSHEAMLWFTSRGDECLNCDGADLLMGFGPLIIRVNK